MKFSIRSLLVLMFLSAVAVWSFTGIDSALVRLDFLGAVWQWSLPVLFADLGALFIVRVCG